MVKVNKGLLAGQIFGNEYAKDFPLVKKAIEGTVFIKAESTLLKSSISIIDLCGPSFSIDGQTAFRKESISINVEEGLLKNKNFNTGDVKSIKINEGVECYGAAAFTYGFTLGFNS